MHNGCTFACVKDKRLISFGQGQLPWLKTKAERYGISVSEYVRRLIDEKREAEAARSPRTRRA